jgi:hypothetical protein
MTAHILSMSIRFLVAMPTARRVRYLTDWQVKIGFGQAVISHLTDGN